LRPDAGRIWLDDDEVTALGERALMRVRAKIGMVFQNYALFDYLTVGENIGFPLTRLGDASAADIAAKVALRLAQVHLPGIEARFPGELSGGMKKRVCVARATVHDPPFLLCDDPTAGLDPVTTNRIFGLLKALQAEHGATLLIVSHEVAALAPLCDRFVMLRAGQVVFDGPPDQAHTAEDPEVRAFVGQAPVFAEAGA
ncbi:MAG: ATP-binding cassette domain-containing protein, partial [Myxococcales bacterium]|nr:ATP-binding cassette domain-containing protein [Myxococcales bacterium]